MMSGKKKVFSGWRPALLGLAVTAAVEALGCTLAALLCIRGVLVEERLIPALTAVALCAALLGGLAAGRGRFGSGGALVNAAVFAGLLAACAFTVWEGVTAGGMLLLTATLTGGAAAALVLRKVGKRRGKRLVRFNKKARFS